MTATPPPGFAPHTRRSPLTEPWEPIFARRDEGGFTLGLAVDRPHTNSRGLAHGGLLSALADNAMGIACALALGGRPGLVTAQLSLDLMGAAKPGQWLEVAGRPLRTGRTLCFAEALLTADGALVAKATGIFRVLEAEGREG